MKMDINKTGNDITALGIYHICLATGCICANTLDFISFYDNIRLLECSVFHKYSSVLNYHNNSPLSELRDQP